MTKLGNKGLQIKNNYFNKGFFQIFVLICVVLVVVVAYIFLQNKGIKLNQESILPNIEKISNVVIPAATPFPFNELTIPYLRERSYQSSLGELEKLSENQDYTSYLTNFNSDGLKINGLLTLPKQKDDSPQKHPAIVFIHGYIPPTLYKTQGPQYQSYVDYLARNGFVIFKIDLRGHGDSQGEPGGAYYSSDYIIDTLNAYSALKNSDFVDANKIGLWGHSMAGNVTMRSFAANPEIPAVVVWAGAGYTYSDLQEYRISDNSYRPPTDNTERQRKRELLFNTHGQFNTESEFWRQVAITDYLDDLKGQVQLHHAVNDDVVSIEYSRNLTKLLDEANVSNELYEYQSGGHNLTGASFTQAMQRTVEFFRENL